MVGVGKITNKLKKTPGIINCATVKTLLEC